MVHPTQRPLIHMTSPRPISPFAIPAGYEQAKRGRWIGQSKLNERQLSTIARSKAAVPFPASSGHVGFAHSHRSRCLKSHHTDAPPQRSQGMSACPPCALQSGQAAYGQLLSFNRAQRGAANRGLMSR